MKFYERCLEATMSKPWAFPGSTVVSVARRRIGNGFALAADRYGANPVPAQARRDWTILLIPIVIRSRSRLAPENRIGRATFAPLPMTKVTKTEVFFNQILAQERKQSHVPKGENWSARPLGYFQGGSDPAPSSPISQTFRSMRPNLIVIGATKCGTSSLHQYLDCHPDIVMSHPKELRFFTKNWHKGLAWYEAQFSEKASIRGETSPQYTMYPRNRGVAERMHAILPEAKLIYMVRDPIDRVISHYLEQLGQFREHREIDRVLENFEDDRRAPNQYVYGSLYHLQLEQYLRFYSPSRIHVVALEDLKTDPATVLRGIFQFLNVDDHFDSGQFSVVWNDSGTKRRKSRIGRLLYPNSLRKALHNERVPYRLATSYKKLVWLTGEKVTRPVLGAPLVERLRRAFADDVRSLRALTGLSFDKWRSYELPQGSVDRQPQPILAYDTAIPRSMPR
jgi:Sulfotransferase domain